MTAPEIVVLATRNPGKVVEFARLLGGRFVVELVPDEVELPEETGRTFEENARLKAETVYTALGGGLTVLADDSGLEVAALGGRPGVLSARYAGDRARDEENVDKLLEELKGQSDRAARFVCALCLVLASEPRGDRAAPRLIEVRGTVEGTIALAPRGLHGFGYDPVFRPQGAEGTLGEVSPASKDRVSHRGAAVTALLVRLRDEGLSSCGY
ncbi:MAG: RdgB/HAM1 family non-canonical purine NTP pyrophosphatase [bacterium]